VFCRCDLEVTAVVHLLMSRAHAAGDYGPGTVPWDSRVVDRPFHGAEVDDFLRQPTPATMMATTATPTAAADGHE